MVSRFKKPDRTGALLIAIMGFALYLSLANLLWFAGIVTLPLGSAVPDPTPITLGLVAISLLYISYKQRRKARV